MRMMSRAGVRGWVGLFLTCGIGLVGCGGGTGHPDGGGFLGRAGSGGAGGNGGTGGLLTTYVYASPNRKVDILFMVDDSSSMEVAQTTLAAGLPAFMNVLKGLRGGLPDLHVGVVTADMGAGDGSITGCMGNGKNGVFRFAPTGSCTATTLQPGATYITDTGGSSPTTNFSAADITNVLQCLIKLGASGCGFEQQLASVTRALGADGAGPPAENAGFLRSDAYLAIVMLTNEDDCSAPSVNSILYDTNSNTMLASQVGPPGNFRCNEFGHLCSRNGGPPTPPLRLSLNPTDLTTTVSYDDCVSSEGMGLLTAIDVFVQRVKALKADPANQIVVASIQGPTTPYVERWLAAPIPDTGPWPQITHSCDGGAAVGFADPGIRMQQFAQAFGANGLEYSICSNDFSPALTAIAGKVAAVVAQSSCLVGAIRNKDLTGATFDPDCTVTAYTVNAQNVAVKTAVPSCSSTNGTGPCWQAVTDSACAPDDHAFVFTPGSTPPQSNDHLKIECVACLPGVFQPGCP
jgi:hypothetical protein